MKLKQYLQELDKRLYLVFLLSIGMLFGSWSDKDISEVSITTISILFGFGLSFFIAIYSQNELNLYLKETKLLTGFIDDNKDYLKNLLIAIIVIYILGLFSSYEKIFTFNILSLDISLYFSINPIIAYYSVYSFIKTIDFLDNYTNLYKNTYSKTLNKFIKKNKDI